MPSSCFKGEAVIKEFHIDVSAYVDFHRGRFYRDTILCGWSVCCLPLICDLPYLTANITDKANATHLAVTSTHIIYCVDKYKTCWRIPPTDHAKIVKKIPVDRISDIVILEPAGDCCPPNALYTVTVQTAAKSIEGAEVSVTGLSKDDVYEFRRLALEQQQRSVRNTTMRRI